MDVSAAKAAVQTAVTYPRLIHEAALRAQSIALGPWTVSISCNYGTSDANHYLRSLSVDFAMTRTQLQQALAIAESRAETFLDHFNFVRVWMGETMPLTSTLFATAAQSVDTAVAANQNGTLTQAMVDAARHELSELASSLQDNSKQLSDGLAGLAQFNIQLGNCGQQIQHALGTLKSTAQNEIAQAIEMARSAPCGGDGAMSQIAAFQAQLATSGSALDSTFTTLAGQTRDAENAVAVLQGTVLNLLGNYRGVLDQLKTVEAQAAASMMQKIRLMVASNAWKDLTQYATAQLGNERAQLQAQLSQVLARVSGAEASASPLFPVMKALERVYGPAQ
jgi:hypothetical protein